MVVTFGILRKTMLPFFFSYFGQEEETQSRRGGRQYQRGHDNVVQGGPRC